jgi:hypothetical protein
VGQFFQSSPGVRGYSFKIASFATQKHRPHKFGDRISHILAIETETRLQQARRRCLPAPRAAKFRRPPEWTSSKGRTTQSTEGGGWLGDGCHTKPSSPRPSQRRCAEKERKVDVPLLHRGGCLEQGDPGALVGEHLLPACVILGVLPGVVRPRVSPALLKRRLQSVAWMPRLLQFFQLLLAELGAARRCGS